MKDITVIIPAYNEADNIKKVISDLNVESLNNIIVAIDANTRDTTKLILDSLKVKNVISKTSGYDPTVLSGIKVIKKYFPNTNYVLFADAGRKYSFKVVKDFYKQIKNNDMVLGVRIDAESTMLWHQKLGTQIVLLMINTYFKTKIKDITPFRLISYDLLIKLKLQGAKFQLPTEMLVKALAVNAKIKEVSIISKPRVGKSKVSGNLKNSFRAGLEMLSAIKYANYGKKF